MRTMDIYFCGLWGEIVCLKEETGDFMSKLFHVTLQKWQAQTGDLLETLTKFLLYFLTTYDESNHQSLIVRIQRASPLQNLLLFQRLHASLQAWPVGVSAAVEALHFPPQDAELRQARHHLRLRQTALPLNRARPSRVAGGSGFPHGELRRLQPGFQASEGLQHFHNLRSSKADEIRQCNEHRGTSPVYQKQTWAFIICHKSPTITVFKILINLGGFAASFCSIIKLPSNAISIPGLVYTNYF